jgi:hypothetical protein
MPYSMPLTWFAKCAVAAVVVLLACAVATARFGASLDMPSVTTRDGTLMALNRYVNEPTPDVVLVGSSLGYRLNETYFATPGLRNLAIAGGSPVTGLAIVARQERLPKIVLVETNVLSRPIDTSLVERYAAKGAGEQLLFRPVRAAVAALELWTHAPPGSAQRMAARDQLLRQPPDNFDNSAYIARVIREQSAENPAEAVRDNVRRIAELIAAIERRGSRVLLLEIPYPPEVRQALATHITDDIAHKAFPDPARWLNISLPQNELRWPDGGHLDERSALVTARAIDAAVAPMIK